MNQDGDKVINNVLKDLHTTEIKEEDKSITETKAKHPESNRNENIDNEEINRHDGINRSYCICRKEAYGKMLHCDSCHDWFHLRCVNVPQCTLKKIGDYICPICRGGIQYAGALNFDTTPPHQRSIYQQPIKSLNRSYMLISNQLRDIPSRTPIINTSSISKSKKLKCIYDNCNENRRNASKYCSHECAIRFIDPTRLSL